MSRTTPESHSGGPDTIAAIATASGQAGVGIVRISGPESERILRDLTGASVLTERKIHHGWAQDSNGERLDEVLYFLMRGPRSFTGEDVAEVHGHGGAVNIARLLREVLTLGARLAEPGEFTRRAFCSGRIDLTRAEGIAQIVSATSEAGLRAAQRQLAGDLGSRVRQLFGRCKEMMAHLEKAIDFPEDDVSGDNSMGHVATALEEQRAAIADLVQSFGLGRALTSGIQVAIRGPVNAGKSSLFNALYEKERALVAASPGTTRDFLEGQVEWDGIRVELIDTAGERQTECEVEAQGVALGTARAKECDVEVHLEEWHPAVALAKGVGRTVRVVSKIDLARTNFSGELGVSSKTGAGLDALRQEILSRVMSSVDPAREALVTSERQRGLLAKAEEALAMAARQAGASQPIELVAADVARAGRHLGEVLGEDCQEAMLDQLFASFCIGK